MASPDLAVRRRPHLRLLGWAAAVVGLAGLTAWYVNTPPALPASAEAVSGTVPVGESLYVGVFTPGPRLGRELRLSGVKVHVVADAPVEVRPLLCRGGSLSVTTAPDTFCADLVEPDGRTMTGADAIVLEITGDHAGEVEVDRVRLGYREGIRADTQAAGAPARVTLLER